MDFPALRLMIILEIVQILIILGCLGIHVITLRDSWHWLRVVIRRCEKEQEKVAWAWSTFYAKSFTFMAQVLCLISAVVHCWFVIEGLFVSYLFLYFLAGTLRTAISLLLACATWETKAAAERMRR